ncbi:MAG: alpha-glucosidase C-terminal domain-containing protein [Ignavibacteriales bacterium]|nr:alpha-glucosidase C-terminal domain-containing protein [Ignavibacteriales bacterium]
MKLIIDLVINHTSWDSKLIQQHPEWFMKDSTGSIISPNDDWSDVADLDYSKPALRRYMLEMMEWWVKDIGIDGFRCDVSELIPIDFWNEARERLNQIKPVMMLSEGSLPEHHLKAFDITYSWNLYDALDALLRGKLSVTFIDTLLNQEQSEFPANSLRLRFNTNHDKNVWDAPAIEKFGFDGLKLTSVLINTIPGIPLLYNGEEVANDKRLNLFDKVEIDWNRPRTMDSLHKILFKLRKDNVALSRGKFVKIPTSNDNEVYTFFRVDGDNKIIVALNFSNEKQPPELYIPFDLLLGKKQKMKMKDILSNTSLTIERQKPCTLSLTPFGCQILLLEK